MPAPVGGTSTRGCVSLAESQAHPQTALCAANIPTGASSADPFANVDTIRGYAPMAGSQDPQISLYAAANTGKGTINGYVPMAESQGRPHTALYAANTSTGTFNADDRIRFISRMRAISV